MLFVYIFTSIKLAYGTGNLRKCIQTLRKITVQPSCMKCDPALQYCQSGCQALVGSVYTNCDNICLPDGYYFDERKLLLSDS